MSKNNNILPGDPWHLADVTVCQVYVDKLTWGLMTPTTDYDIPLLTLIATVRQVSVNNDGLPLESWH